MQADLLPELLSPSLLNKWHVCVFLHFNIESAQPSNHVQSCSMVVSIQTAEKSSEKPNSKSCSHSSLSPGRDYGNNAIPQRQEPGAPDPSCSCPVPCNTDCRYCQLWQHHSLPRDHECPGPGPGQELPPIPPVPDDLSEHEYASLNEEQVLPPAPTHPPPPAPQAMARPALLKVSVPKRSNPRHAKPPSGAYEVMVLSQTTPVSQQKPGRFAGKAHRKHSAAALQPTASKKWSLRQAKSDSRLAVRKNRSEADSPVNDLASLRPMNEEYYTPMASTVSEEDLPIKLLVMLKAALCFCQSSRWYY